MTATAAGAVAGVTALVVSLAVVRLLLGTRLQERLLDVPNHRSLHARPVPRGGGLGILAGLAAGYGALVWSGALTPVATPALLAVVLLTAVSILDDARPLPVTVRLPVHLSAAALLLAASGPPAALTVAPGLTVHPGAAIASVLAVMYLVWMTNLYNFMDGMDGLAGTMAVTGFGCFAVLGAFAGAWPFATLSLVVSAAAAGFVVFNLPPARIFLGDVGSVPLGFMAAAFSLQAQRDGVFPLWVGLLVFSPFIVDATVTLARRALARERFWEAHRDHHYQRMVRAGWSHGRTLRWCSALMLACAASAVAVVLAADPRWSLAIGLGWAIGYTALVTALSRMWRRRSRAADATGHTTGPDDTVGTGDRR